MMRSLHAALACMVLLAATAGNLHAGIINSANVTIGSNQYRTFTDTTTSLVWLDLDNFWHGTSTYNSITSLLSGSGFHLATLTELSVLQASIPATPANFASEVLILGGNYTGNPNNNGYNRNLIWGIYEDGNSADGVSWAWKFNTDTTWNKTTNIMLAGTQLADYSDLGAWVVADSISAVPVPSSMALMVIGACVCGVGGEYHRRRTKRQENAV